MSNEVLDIDPYMDESCLFQDGFPKLPCSKRKAVSSFYNPHNAGHVIIILFFICLEIQHLKGGPIQITHERSGSICNGRPEASIWFRGYPSHTAFWRQSKGTWPCASLNHWDHNVSWRKLCLLRKRIATCKHRATGTLEALQQAFKLARLLRVP